MLEHVNVKNHFKKPIFLHYLRKKMLNINNHHTETHKSVIKIKYIFLNLGFHLPYSIL